MGGGVGVAAADPPDAVQADTLHGAETDLRGVGGIGFNVEDAQTGSEGTITSIETISQRVVEVVLLVLVFLHRPDVRGIDRKHDPVMDLQVAGAGVGCAGQEVDGARVARIGEFTTVMPSQNIWPI